MSKLRKIFTVSVMAMTILSMSVVVAPQAQAKASAGDLIKMSGLSSVYYLAADGKRYVFPNESTYFSWYSDWSGVVTISQSELEGYPLGKNVIVRPGTKLVKITTNPVVYAVEPDGTLRSIVSEANAKALWGDNWAKRVVDVPDSFWQSYTIGTALTAGTYPTGSLVKFSGSTDTFYIASDGKAQKVETAAITANRFKTADVATAASTVVKPAEGTPIAGAVATLTDTSSGAGGTVVVASGSGLSVALASNTPASATVVADTTNGAQAMIPAMKLNFTAAADGAVIVKTVKITRSGISSDTDIVNMYLYDGATSVASNPSISTKVFTFSNSAGLFTVPAGQTKTIDVKFDLKNAASAGITINFSIAAASDITTGGAAVSGSFPMTSNTFTAASVTDLGKFTLTTVAPAAAGNVDAGQNAYEIWRFTAAASTQDVELRKIKFTMVGSMNIGDIRNFGLWDGATQIGTTVADMASDKTVDFDLSAAPYNFAKGVTRTLSLKADIIGGSTRTFRATIQNASDLIMYDKGYGVFLKHNATDTFTVIQPGATVNYTISSGTLTMSVAADSPTGNIASSTTNVVLSKITVKANGEDVKISSMNVTCTDSNTTKKLKNLKLLWDGSQVGSTVATTDVCDGATNTLNTFSFGSTVIARVGQTHTLSIVADVTGTTNATETISANIVTSSNGQGLVSLSTVTVPAVVGRTLTIAAGTLTAAINQSFGSKTAANPTGVVNGANTKIGSFVLIGGAGEAAEVTQIAVGDVTAATAYISAYAQNLKLMHGTTQLGMTLASPASGLTTAQTHTFNISPAVTIAAGEQYVVDVYADLKSTALSASALLKFASVTANGKTTGTTASYSTAFNLQNIEISAAGGLTIATDTDTRLATNLLMGAVDEELAKFKFTASSSESISISQLVISANVTAGATGTLQNIRLYDGATQIGTAVAGLDTSSASTTYAHAVFTGLNLIIPKGTSKVITVKADITSYEGTSFSTTGQAVQLAILEQYTGTSMAVTGTGSSSGASLTSGTVTLTSNAGSAPVSDLTNTVTATSSQVSANVGNARGNEFVLYRAKLNIAWASDTPSGLSTAQASQNVAKFTITNTANSGGYSATVKYLNFSLSGTISNTAGTDRTLTIYKDSTSTTALGTTTFKGTSMASGTAYSYSNTNIDNAGMTDVEISANSSKTFYVILDTSPAVATNNLSITIPSYHVTKSTLGGVGAFGIGWSDGVTTTIVGSDTLLPLGYKTLTY